MFLHLVGMQDSVVTNQGCSTEMVNVFHIQSSLVITRWSVSTTSDRARCVRCSNICHEAATKQQRSPPAAPSLWMLSKPCVLAALSYTPTCSLWNLLNLLFLHQCVLFLNVAPCWFLDWMKHVRILLWNRYNMMMMYCTNKPTNRK